MHQTSANEGFEKGNEYNLTSTSREAIYLTRTMSPQDAMEQLSCTKACPHN